MSAIAFFARSAAAARKADVVIVDFSLGALPKSLTGGTIQITDTNAAGQAERFYRVRTSQ